MKIWGGSQTRKNQNVCKVSFAVNVLYTQLAADCCQQVALSTCSPTPGSQLLPFEFCANRERLLFLFPNPFMSIVLGVITQFKEK